MNINNISKLLKAYFYENWQRDLYYTFCISAALALMCVVLFHDITITNIVAATLIIVAPTYRIFTKLYNSSSRMHYLTIPASNSEKVVTGMILANIYYVLGILISIFIGFFIGLGILKIYDSEMAKQMFGQIKSFCSFDTFNVLAIYYIISMVFFASIYFRRNAFWKLLLVGFIVSSVLSLVLIGTVWLNEISIIPKEFLSGGYYKTENYIAKANNWIPEVMLCVGIVYFYAMSFLRMRETEA